MSRVIHILSYLAAGIRNKPGRNAATAFCFAFIAANIFSGQFLLAGAAEGVNLGVSRMGADHIVVPLNYLAVYGDTSPASVNAIISVLPSAYRFSSDILQRVREFPEVSRASPQVYIATMTDASLSPSPVDIIGFDPETDFVIQPWLSRPLGGPLLPGEVIAGHDVAGSVSTRMSLSGREFTIAGRLDPTNSPADHALFLRMDDAYELGAAGDGSGNPQTLSPAEISGILVQGKAGYTPEEVGSRIRRSYLPRSVSVIDRNFALRPASREVAQLPGLLGSISGIVILGAFPLIAVIASMVARERQQEIGFLRAMGAKRSVIGFLVVSESIALAAIGGLAGIAACLAYFTLADALEVPGGLLQASLRLPSIPAMLVIAGTALAAVIAIAGLSSLYPAIRSSTMNPYDAIRNDGL